MEYPEFSANMITHIAIWGFLFVTSVFIIAAGAFAKNE